MKILVTGGSGQLGHDVVDELSKRGHTTIAPSHLDLDISDSYAVSRFFHKHTLDAVIHCAAYTAVDKAETEEQECRKTNVEGTRNITNQCIHYNLPEILISTDYVFDGNGSKPWDINDPVNPINVYGRSKADAEKIVLDNPKHFIVRISWVFGVNGNNFIKTMLNLSKKTEKLSVVSDQIGSPTYTCDLAPLLCDMIGSTKYGTYHAHNEGYCSWYDFACKIFETASIKIEVSPITSKEYPTKANRPLNSRMSTSSLATSGFNLLPEWENSVERFIT